jgi:hypothetical protein
MSYKKFWLALHLLVLFAMYWLPTWDDWSVEELTRKTWGLLVLLIVFVAVDRAERKDPRS